MVESLIKTEAIPSDLRKFIQTKDEGNPFYLEEAINALIESETLVRDNGCWKLTKQISEAVIPPTVQGIISARLDRLELNTKRFLQKASVIGRAFFYEILTRIADPEDHVDKSLKILEGLDFIRTRSIQPELEYTFKHASQVYEYAVNPYVGCSHGCVYCYAKFMKRFTGHKENWGEFVDVKTNAPELVAREIKRKHPGRVWISGVCDPYQAIEKKYGITRRCVEILIDKGWPVSVQTKSPLVVRDAEILKRSPESEVCLTITTSDEKIRRILEPGAPSIEKRIEALGILHSEGIRTLVMVAPILHGAAWLFDRLEGRVDHALIDRLNYHYADRAPSASRRVETPRPKYVCAAASTP